jgi:Zn-dependent protease
MPVEETGLESPRVDPASGKLPPEVEAALRQRLQGRGDRTPAAPWLQHTSGEEAASPRVEEPPSPERSEAQSGPQCQKPDEPLPALPPGNDGPGARALDLRQAILKTGVTMLLSVVVCAQFLGWQQAVGLVLSILAHELGHVYAASRLGIPVSAPLFLPGFGAFVLLKKQNRSTWDDALIGIGGPIAGALAGLICWLIHGATGSAVMLKLAYLSFALNLVNLAPIGPLDGRWITAAISPRIWLLGIVGMIALFTAGVLRSPFLILLLLLSLPRLWTGLKKGDLVPVGGIPTTPWQRRVMGVSYVALCAFLVWLIAHTHRV